MGNAESLDECTEPIEVANASDELSVTTKPFDLSVLLDGTKLQQSLGTNSEPLEGEVSRHRDQLLSWLRGLQRANEVTVSSLQFVEEAVGFGVSRKNATEFFNCVDRYSNGQLQCTSLISALQDSSSRSILQSCSPCIIAPGAVDVYSDGGAVGMGEKLMQFVQRNRAFSDLLSLPGYEASLTQFTLREKLVHSRYINWKNSDEDRDKPSDDKGQQLMDIKKCFSKVTVSSNDRSIDNLLDNNASTYWQSNGSPRRHWIRLHMLPGVMVKELAITVNQSDDSYMPKKVAILVGSSESNLRDLKEVEVPRNLTGKFVIAKAIRSYRYVQVNIRGCHSDGCDTRIRGISVKGYKFVEEKKPLVLDTLVTWHLGLLASTALSSVETAPALRDILITQSSVAFKQLKPLILSSSSAERPEFFSSFVVTEISQFLHKLCLEQSKPHNIAAMETLLYFSVATGNLNGLLHSLRLLLANAAQQLVGVAELLLSIDEILLSKRRAHSEQLKLTVASCSGGHSEQANNIITNQLTSGTAYSSKSSKTNVVFSFKDKEDRHFIVYKLIVKVPSGDHGAKEGFVFTASSPDEVQQLESLDLKDKPPANHFTIDTDTHMAEVTLATVKADKLLVIRFLSSESSADHVSIHCVQPYGYILSDRELWYSDNIPSSLVMPAADEAISGTDILSNMLSLLIKLVQDRRVLWQRLAHNQMDTALSVEAHVEVEQLSLQEVWLLYQQLIGQKEAIQCLQLLHCCLPFLEAKRNAKNTDVASEVLKHLCSVVDKEVEYSNDVIEKMAHDIILDGIVVFFPDSSARRSHLISMLDSVMSKELPTSWWVKFEALCVHFSSQDPSALLGLQVTNESNTEALVILKTIVTIVTRDALSMKRPRCSDLVQLLGSLQATVFFWCQTEWEGKSIHTALVSQYIVHFTDNCLKVIQKVSAQDDKLTILNYLQQSLLATVLPQLLYLINSLKAITDLHQVAMRNLYPLVKEIYNLTTAIPELSMGTESSGIESNQSEAIIDVKVIESSHNYNNSAVISEEFNFEEASRLVVEFDSRCSTETDCDVLTFANAQGTSQRCHGKVGTETWPKTLQFQGGKLTFTFHSDGSNTDWGYRFCIKVYSKQKKSFHWLFDLQLSLTRLLGQLCSSALAEAAVANDNKSKQDEEEILVRSDVWKTLFRGGYQTSKLTRSLSGAHSAMPSESRLNEYLVEMANGVSSCSLLEQCHLGQQGVVPPQYGGAVVDKTINAIFASLIWHCQELRDEVKEFVMKPTLSPRLSSQLLKVYSIAQDMRRELVEARRKVMEENEGETSEGVNEDTPIIACHEKALFLLKFSGLTKVSGAHMQQVSPSSRSSWLRKSLQWKKMGSIDWKPSKLSHQVSIVEDDGKDLDPSIKMVLDFVKDERVTKDLVHSLLQHRSKRAKTISYVFTFCAEFVQLFMPHIFQLPVIVFLQQLLSQQQGFPPHYAAKLDGCGLERENDVRKAYYLLLTKIIDAVRSCRSQDGTGFPASYYLVKSYLLHLLDIDWQDYDNSFILEQELPELFLETAITSFKPTDKVDVFPMETELMERYQLQSKLRETLLELKSFTKVMEHFKDFEPQKELHYFLVTAIHVVENVIMVTCDGCSARIGGQWYRSLESSENCDLCETCFNDGTGSRPDDHTKEHLFIRLGRFICDGCRMLITSHRFHSNTKDDYDLCLGCYRANGGHGDQWTYYPITIIPKTDKRNPYYSINPEESEGMFLESNTLLKPGKLTNIRTYNHQHAMLLFSSLCLDISNKVTATTANSEYRQSAVTIHLNCLKLLTFCLRASLSGAEENTAMLKKKEKEKEEAEGAGASKAKEQNSDEDGSHGDKTKEQKSDDDNHGDTVTVEIADKQLSKQMSHDDKSTHELIKKSSHKPDKSHGQKTSSNNHQTTLQSLHEVTSQDKQVNCEESFGTAEKHFSFTSLEKILGLLACLIPSETSLSYWSSTSRIFLIDRLLPVLLNISQCCHVRPQQQLQAILIVARYVSKLKPQDGDRIVMEAQDTCHEDGVKLVQYFFTLGANYLSKSDFSGAAAVADVLNILCAVTTWKKVVTIVISHCFSIPKKVELSSLFGLLVTAGFPRLLRVGSIVQVASSDDDKCVVTDISSSQSVTCVNIISRTLTVVPRKDLEISQSSITGCANITQLQDILHLLNNLKLRTTIQSSQAVELNWMASLLLKSIFIILQQNADSKGSEVIQAILDANILATIVQWASQPTQLSQKWLLSDLEVLSVHLYQPHADDTVTIETKEVLPQQPVISRSSSVKENDPLTGLPADVKEIITNMQEAFNCSFAVLRAMYEMADQDLTKWMELVQGSYDDGALRPSEEAVAKSKEWEPASVREVVQQIQDSANDNGVLLFTPINTDLKNMVATDESSSTLKVQLMSPPSTNGTNKANQHREREESHELLQTELKKDDQSSNRDDMLKVNKALVVLHSRQFLASLLAQWENSSIPLSCSLLGGINVMQLFCLLDLLVRSQYNSSSDKILHSLVSCGVDEELQQLSLTAAQCMGEVSVGNKYCSSKHPLAPSDDVIKDHVTIPNASSLSVTFDSKCNLAGELVLASDEGFSKHVKTFKNSAPWDKHIIPGDTVFYKVTTGKSCDHWGWGFTIIGSQVGRFETGYMLLSNLLHQSQNDNKRILPLKKLWPWLAAVACQHTGCRRLQTVKLLMELLHMQQLPTTHASLVVAESRERVDLAVLKPLWQLYTKMLKKYEDDSQQGNTPLPQIARALTELFLLVENVAEDWGIAQDHLIDMLTTEGLNTWLEKGISNVALVSIALGLNNSASKQFLEAKRNYVPTEKLESNNDTSSDDTKSSTSSSDDENSFDEDDDNDYLYSGSSSS